MSKEEKVPDQEAPPCYSLSELMVLMAGKMEETARTLDVDQAARFLDEMLAARRVYVAGAGRSGLVSRAFAMRLMHIGFESYVIGETITPAFSAGDTLVAFSGSGETNSIFDICETAKELGGKLCLITASPDSRIARIADCMVMLGRQSHAARRQASTRFARLWDSTDRYPPPLHHSEHFLKPQLSFLLIRSSPRSSRPVTATSMRSGDGSPMSSKGMGLTSFPRGLLVTRTLHNHSCESTPHG